MLREDPWTRARKATEEMEHHLAAIARLADERALAIQELLDTGLTRSEVARRLGVTPAVITKLLKRPVVGDAFDVDQHSPSGKLTTLGRRGDTAQQRPRAV